MGRARGGGRTVVPRRAGGQLRSPHQRVPIRFQLIAAMNPCVCGWLGDASDQCRCTPPMLDRYRARVSGPLLDRIDLHVEVPRVSVSSLAEDTTATESSAAIRVRVLAARARATIRLARLGIAVNAHIPG